jgi:hypothetical protein
MKTISTECCGYDYFFMPTGGFFYKPFDEPKIVEVTICEENKTLSFILDNNDYQLNFSGDFSDKSLKDKKIWFLANKFNVYNCENFGFFFTDPSTSYFECIDQVFMENGKQIDHIRWWNIIRENKRIRYKNLEKVITEMPFKHYPKITSNWISYYGGPVPLKDKPPVNFCNECNKISEHLDKINHEPRICY